MRFIIITWVMDSVNSQIPFTSLIRPVSLTEFTRVSEPLYSTAFVKSPWTVKETVKAKKAFTMDVFDCTAGGIVDLKNKRVVMFHICPEMKENGIFSEIEKYIMGLVGNIHSDLRAFLTGSNVMFPDSYRMYSMLKQMILRRKIPLSELRNSSMQTHLLYDASKDEWLVSNFEINSELLKGKKSPLDILKGCFDEVVIEKGDTVV